MGLANHETSSILNCFECCIPTSSGYVHYQQITEFLDDDDDNNEDYDDNDDDDDKDGKSNKNVYVGTIIISIKSNIWSVVMCSSRYDITIIINSQDISEYTNLTTIMKLNLKYC